MATPTFSMKEIEPLGLANVEPALVNRVSNGL
jgi:hypothetical protein